MFPYVQSGRYRVHREGTYVPLDKSGLSRVLLKSKKSSLQGKGYQSVIVDAECHSEELIQK